MMRNIFKRRRPTHRAKPMKFGYRPESRKLELCLPCVALYGIEAVRSSHEPPAQPVFSERYIAALNGHTPEEWAALPEIARKDAREHVAWKVRA